MLTRRDAVFGLSFTAAAGLSGMAYAQPKLGWTPTALTPAEAATLDAAAELIMPATDSPGAREAGVPAFIDRTIGGWCDKTQAKVLRDGLARMDADARAAGGKSFAALPAAQQTALLTRYEAEGGMNRLHFWGALKELVTIGYFTSKPGATIALRYDPVPGAYRGCVPLKEIGRAWAT
jgi:hypothetical protein